MNIKTVTVIGANGNMGANLSAIFASLGDATVYMVSRNIEKSRSAVLKAVKSVRADSIASKLIPADYSELENCLAKSDLIFESVAEDFEIKKDIIALINRYAVKGSIIATGTSGLSVNGMSALLNDDLKPYFFGVHFFNPPYSLNLCELISPDSADKKTEEELADYLKNKLLRTLVPVKDRAAFLGNRIGFRFINAAMRLAEECKEFGGIDYVDAIFGSFTGRSMPPLVTADFVGLDVHKAIVDNVYKNDTDFFADDFILPEFAQKLIDRNMLGKKSGVGFYKTEIHEDGSKEKLVYDIESDEFRPIVKYGLGFADKMKKSLKVGDYAKALSVLIGDDSKASRLCLKYLTEYIVYSVIIAEQVGFSVSGSDDVMATGFNWCPPLALAGAFETVLPFEKIIEISSAKLPDGISAKYIAGKIKKSKYDYRPYFKAR